MEEEKEMVISFRAPERLVLIIDKLAVENTRNRSQQILHLLKEYFELIDKRKISQLIDEDNILEKSSSEKNQAGRLGKASAQLGLKD